MKLRVHRHGTKATVLVQYPDKKPSEGQSTRLRIVVPADSDLDADTGEGGIRVLGSRHRHRGGAGRAGATSK